MVVVTGVVREEATKDQTRDLVQVVKVAVVVAVGHRDIRNSKREGTVGAAAAAGAMATANLAKHPPSCKDKVNGSTPGERRTSTVRNSAKREMRSISSLDLND